MPRHRQTADFAGQCENRFVNARAATHRMRAARSQCRLCPRQTHTAPVGGHAHSHTPLPAQVLVGHQWQYRAQNLLNQQFSIALGKSVTIISGKNPVSIFTS